MRKYIILPILLISLFCSPLFASKTISYTISAFKQSILTADNYNMHIYDTLHGSVELLGGLDSSRAVEAHKASNVDISSDLQKFFYNSGEAKIDDFNENLLFAVLSFGSTRVPKNSSISIHLTVNITGFEHKENGTSHFIPVYVEYGIPETKYLNKPDNISVLESPIVSPASKNITATNAAGSSIKQTLSFTNTENKAATVSWEDAISFAIAINRDDYNSAPLGNYVATVTVTLEAE